MSDIRVPPIDEVASTVNDEERREIAQELRHYAVYAEVRLCPSGGRGCNPSPRARTIFPIRAVCSCAWLA